MKLNIKNLIDYTIYLVFILVIIISVQEIYCE
jgi:hypothetical protein